MKVLRWIGIVLAAVLLGIAGVAAGARFFSDGPIGPFPGGALEAGELASAPVDDWAFARDVREVELQLVEPQGSRVTWILVHEGKAYIPCGVPYFTLWKQWPHQAVADGRAILRMEGRRYPLKLVKMGSASLGEKLTTIAAEKYGVGGEYDPDLIWFFRLDPRS